MQLFAVILYICLLKQLFMERQTYDRIIDILHREVKPALGCTEPIAVAIAVARAASEGDVVSKVEVKVSPNILKNAMGVGIPGTGLTGLPVAAALAVVCGKWEYGLEVLKEVSPESVEAAKRFSEEGRVSVSLADSHKMLYAEADCTFEDGSTSVCIIEDEHDSIVYVARNGEVIEDRRKDASAESVDEAESGKFLKLSLVYEFATTCDLADLDLMREEVAMNTAISDEGLRGDYGLKVGKTICAGINEEVFGTDLMAACMSMTAAASDARMAGCTMPAMSNSGSGNQGLTVSLPVIAAARHLKSSEEQLLRALVLSNLIAIHIKSYLGRLSALCGCVVASTGAACGIVMLRGGSVSQMGATIKNMIGSITGMVCDGAKEGCAMKVASGVSCALQSAVLALDGICVNFTDGIIDQQVEKTISNLGEIGSRGMLQTDSVILDIMVCK